MAPVAGALGSDGAEDRTAGAAIILIVAEGRKEKVWWGAHKGRE